MPKPSEGQNNRKVLVKTKFRTSVYQIAPGCTFAHIGPIRKASLPNVSVRQFREFTDDRDFIQIHSSLRKFFVEDIGFRNDLEYLFEIARGGKVAEFFPKKTMSENRLLEIKNTLFQYLIEELAIIIYFTEKGYPIEIDPTIEFTTKKLLYDNGFPQIK